MKKNTLALVTGGCGFIGTHLCRGLVAEGFNVRVLDRRVPEQPVSGVEYRQAEIENEVAVSDALEGARQVFHLAAVASVDLCEADPLGSYRTNVQGSLCLLEALRRRRLAGKPPARLIFSSSAAVYGRAGTDGRAVNESERIDLPLSHYALQKRMVEQAIRLYHRDGGLEALVLRFFNVFGRGQDPHSPYSGVITIFQARLASGQPIVLQGGGRQTRDFITISDVVSALLAGAAAPVPVCNGQTINIGSGRSVSIHDLALAMMRVAGKKSPLSEGPPRAGDVPHSLAAIERAKTLLNWEPRQTLEQGLEELLPSGESLAA